MFGDRASPYLAQYVVRQHAEDNRDNYPLAVTIILLQMYMDDIRTSLETEDEAIKAREQLRELLGKASKYGVGVVTGQRYLEMFLWKIV